MKAEVDLWELENELYDSGITTLCGVDEAGRGPLAGPVCAAAVILPRGLVIPGLNDSKKLSEKRREALYGEITQKALHWAAAFASVEEIEALNILGATYLAMNRAIAGLGVEPELALIDGNRAKGVEHNCRCVVGGDGKCADIAAASIIAKVTRDRLMYELDEKYPGYGFAKHKGYGTAAHYAAIRELGPCEAHRPSFFEEDALMYKTKLIGREGEAEAARYLERKGYKIIGLNYSCRYGEIDVIAEKDGFAAIVEVKLRESADFAEAREFVTRSKQAKLRRAALHWLMTSGTELQPRFDVVEIYTGGREHIINHIENAFE